MRAVAVAAVVVYHFGGGDRSVLGGGFLGVDLFFVLSGYLITGLLVREHRRTGGIDLVAFWGRRLRRLLPALLLVLVAVCAATWWAAPPETWAARRADVLWALAYLANWHFVGVGEDYFASYTGASPLRHTWSLSIEEQFYLVWPLVVAGVLRSSARHGRRALVVVSAGLVLVSATAMALAFAPGAVSRAYYGTDGRVQQLLVGAVLALLLGRAAAVPSGTLRAVRVGVPVCLVVVGAALVVASDSAPTYYRGGALAFAVVVALVVAGIELDPAGPAARALSWAPAAALGRVSYGVYLWHWPVLVLMPVPQNDFLASALRVAVTLALSAASYRYVERPVMLGRVPRLGLAPRRTLAASLVTALAVAALAVGSTRLPGTLQAQLDDRADTPCPGEAVDALVPCVLHQGGPGAETLMLVGDSTARALTPGLVDQAGEQGTTLVQAAWQRCTPTGLLVVPNGMAEPDAAARGCSAGVGSAIDAALREHRPDVVLVSDYWSHHQALEVDGRRLRPGTAEHAAALRAGFDRLVDQVAAAGARTVLLELPPRGDSIGPQVAAG
ncbi:MAG TPA: acyltransferase family protein, partial [Actinomycetales bacterium]